MIKKYFWIIFLCLLGACQRPHYIDNVVVAEVGKYKLTKPELRSALPAGLTSEDSVAFVRKYVRKWIDERLLYTQGIKHVRNIEALEEQVEEYRCALISQTYETQLLESRVADVTNDECWMFYESHATQLKLELPVIQGLFIKIPTSAPQSDKLREWLKGLESGDLENIEQLESYCFQWAAAYDNFFHDWIDLQLLMENIPASKVIPEEFVSRKGRHEVADSAFMYLVFVKDYRLAGQQQPYEYALNGIRETLRKEKLQALREELSRRLFDEGMKKGTVKFYN